MIWLGRSYIEPKWLSLLLIVVAVSRIHLIKRNRSAAVILVGALLLTGISIWSNALLPLKLYPILVNFSMLCLFGISLFFPPSFCERIARIREPDLPEAIVTYTRKVTTLWCVFFVINGIIAAYTAFCTNDDIWSLYNGVIAYVLIGILFGIEYLFRLRFKRQQNKE